MLADRPLTSLLDDIPPPLTGRFFSDVLHLFCPMTYSTKRWTDEQVQLDDHDYVICHMKRDELEFLELVHLQPAGDPDPVPSGPGPVRPTIPA